MFVQPWDTALDETEWQTWIADGPEGKAEPLRRQMAHFQPDDHKRVEHRTAVADRLTERGQGLDLPTARQQLRRLERVGPWKLRPTHPDVHRNGTRP